MVLPLQLTVPSTPGSTTSDAAARVCSTGSLNTISIPVVITPRRASSETGWVRLISSTSGGRASMVLATKRTPARTSPPTPMTRRLRRTIDRIGRVTGARSAMSEARRKDLELVSVLRDRAPGERDAFLGESVGDLLIGQWMTGILRLDHPLDLVLHAERCGEEVTERDHLPGGDHHVLLRGGAADGGLVHADQLTDLGTRQRDEMLDAVNEVVALAVDQRLGDPVDRRPTAVDVVDEELRASHVLAHVLLLVLGRVVAPQLRAEARVDRSDPQAEAARLDHLDRPLAVDVADH